MPRPILATIHLSALKHNLLRVRSLLNTSLQAHQATPSVWAVIKANAYGHGIENALMAFGEADGLAMLDFEEAQRCRQAGWRKPLLMLEGCFQAQDLDEIEKLSLTPVIHRMEQIEWLARHSFQQPIDVYLKANTGMQRLGFALTDYLTAFNQLKTLEAAGKVRSITHMTHFACADEPNGVQAPLMAFDEVISTLAGAESLCNSAATLRHTQVAYRSRPRHVKPSHPKSLQSNPLTDHLPNWVRPGICLYGSSPFSDLTAASFDLQATQTLSAEIIALQQVKKGQGVGYGYRFIAPHDMRVGVVSCGYADGYPRHAPDFTPVGVHNQITHLVGRVSMDMLAIDLTAIPQAGVGSKVVLWGQGGPSIDDVAQHAGTLGYELLCAVAPRVKRRVEHV